MPFDRSDRLKRLPPYLFAEIDKKKKAAVAEGRDVINMGVGDPDKPTPEFVIRALQEACAKPAHHRYAFDEGLPAFRAAAARWFEKRYGVRLDPDREILPLIGSKEGIAHLPLAILNPGDVSLVPDPGYPPYAGGTSFAGGEPHRMRLRADLGFLPDLKAIPALVVARAKILYLNYPNNPTSALAPRAFLEEAVAFAAKHDLLIAADAAYSEVYFEEKPPSMLQIPGARERTIEFHSLSKTFNMTGWRLGFAAGCEKAVKALGVLKTYLDSGIFSAIQETGAVALDGYDRPEIRAIRDLYRTRRDAWVGGLRSLGLKVDSPKATFYVWTPVPGGGSSIDFCARALEKANVVLTPGLGFGEGGEGYFRAALTVDEPRIREAIERLKKAGVFGT